MDFPFYDAPNTATIVCCHVMDKESPILYVSHEDNSVGELKDMPCGYYTTRESKESHWTVKKS